MSDCINTFTGKAFAPLNPRVEDIDIEDIAHALSNMCRFTGHTRDFFSVAEHSCYVHDVIEKRFIAGGEVSEEEYRSQENTLRWALLHDAAEGFLIDVARPVKRQPQMAFYREAEDKLLTCIARRFKMSGDAPPPVVQEVDTKICVNEARRLLPRMREDLWAGREGLDEEEFSAVVKGLGHHPPIAKMRFLHRFNRLFDGEI